MNDIKDVYIELSDHEKRISILEHDRKIIKGLLVYVGTISTVIIASILLHFGW